MQSERCGVQLICTFALFVLDKHDMSADMTNELNSKYVSVCAGVHFGTHIGPVGPVKKLQMSNVHFSCLQHLWSAYSIFHLMVYVHLYFSAQRSMVYGFFNLNLYLKC